MSSRSPLTTNALLSAVAAWRASPDAAIACPACNAPGLLIVDRSARPHAEWYVLSCQACGLDQTIHIPLGPAVMDGLE